MPYSLGLDSSTQSCSAIVIDPSEGTVIAEASINFGEKLPQYGAPSGFIPNGINGEVHSDPRMWLDALELLLTELAQKCDLSKVSAISGAGQQHGSVYLNESWTKTVQNLSTSKSLSSQISPCLTRKTSPIWMDTSTEEECIEISITTGGSKKICEKSGSIAVERFTGPQIRRFFKTDSAAYAETSRIHLVSSFLCSVLSGCDAPIDTGDGSGMNLLNISTWKWDRDLLDATAPDLFERLPTVVAGDTTVGTISTYFCEKFGFSNDASVTVFTGDNPSSLVGMGASQPGKVVISLGTSDTFFAAMPKVVSDPNGYGHVFGNPTQGSMSLQCFVNGSLAREHVKDHFSQDWDQFTQAFKETPLGNNGNVMLPFFSPEISPKADLQAPIMKGTAKFTSWNDANATMRACVEGQFLNMKLQSEWMCLEPDVIYLTGGASKNNAIAQVIADVFQTRVERLKVSGSVALGAAIRSAVTAMGKSLNKLEAEFCLTDPLGGLDPTSDSKDTYTDSTLKFDNLLKSI